QMVGLAAQIVAGGALKRHGDVAPDGVCRARCAPGADLLLHGEHAGHIAGIVVFKQAQQTAPCIIFIDELDAIGKSRDNRFGSNDEREQTLNQLLSEMDGFDSSKGIIILGATNRPEILDKALLRPGRFDRRIIVERPDLKGRIDTLKVHARDVNMDDTVDFREIALATSGAVGSDLANIVNEAALLAVKNGRNSVSQKDLFESVEVVIAGKEKKDRVLSEKEKRIVAYHEVGHALTSALQKNTEPVQKITIVPRTMGALGYTLAVPEEEKYLMSKEEMLQELVVLYGGRAAEEVRFDSITTGASNDIEKATNMARNMVMLYGMSDKFGPMGMETIENQYLDARANRTVSEATASEVDHEVMQILENAYETAKKLLSENMDALDRIAAYLVERETITGKEFMDLLEKVRADRLKAPEVIILPDKQAEAAAAAEAELGAALADAIHEAVPDAPEDRDANDPGTDEGPNG
ncbi:MAG: AAA family ATPase, partial [Lachnospiraceae bacterium]|nr:AAA family ATPase [Lachnospiraceae bacterium]